MSLEIESIFIKTFLIILFFGGSIFVHELGHFMAARRRGLKVERFSIGFGPKLFGWTKDGVEYRVSLLPLGGYVALPQLADLGAVEGNKQKPEEPLPPISYASKVIVSVMGAVFNLIFAFALALILWLVGQPTSEAAQTTTIGYVAPKIYLDPTDLNTAIESPAAEANLLPGDKILAVDGTTVDNFSAINHAIITGSGRDTEGEPKALLKIERQGEIIEVPIFPELVLANATSGDRLRRIGVLPAHSLVVKTIIENSPAEVSGLQTGDRIIEADAQPLYSLNSLIDYLENNKETPLQLTVQRGDQQRIIEVTPQNVPYTKPLGNVEIKSKGLTASFKLQPLYEKRLEGDLSDPRTASTLVVHEINDPSGVLLEQMEIGDTLLSLNNEPVTSLADFTKRTEQAIQRDATLQLYLGSKRSLLDLWSPSAYTIQLKDTIKASITPSEETPLIGFPIEQGTLIVHLNPFEQFNKQIRTTFQVLKSLIHPNSDISIKHLSGPIGIVRAFSHFSEDLRLIIAFTILLNINLAILNLLPIPVLDGGHILFATIAKLRGKALPVKLLSAIQGTFMVVLFFGLFLYVGFFDVSRLIGDNQTEQRLKLQQSLSIDPVFKTTDSDRDAERE